MPQFTYLRFEHVTGDSVRMRNKQVYAMRATSTSASAQASKPARTRTVYTSSSVTRCTTLELYFSRVFCDMQLLTHNKIDKVSKNTSVYTL